MKRHVLWLLTITSFLFAFRAAQAEVKIVWDRNAADAATKDFKFERVPAPSATDAATNARFSLAAGQEDANAGDLDVLHDGTVPANEDQPEANFFFAPGTASGRLLIDLGAPTEVHQVNTYSWHASTRGPQVYKLYASDGSAPGVAAPPAQAGDPEQAGWECLASVDTRAQSGELGGQYGVSISDSAGGALGRFRYLLFDVACTEKRDPFGHTFFSEIDVSDGQVHAAVPTAPGRCEFVFDTSETPELAAWVDAKLRPICEQWYPKIAEMLGSPGFRPPRRVTITFQRDMRGVAHTSGTRVFCAGDWFRKNLEGEAAGAVVHELVHVVQQFRQARRAERQPGWLVEGLADYIRWFLFEPEALRPRPDPARAKYTDSYRTTGAFLNYVVQTHDPDIVKKFTAALREHKYSSELWKTYTGKTVDELWAEYVQTLKER